MSAIAARLLRRIEMCHRRFEETGEVRWLSAAAEADRLYRRVTSEDWS